MAIGINFNRDSDDLSLNGARVKRYLEEELPPIVHDLSESVVELQKAKRLLKECVEFMNLVPNKKYGDNYKLLSKIGKFLKSTEK